MGGRIDCDDVVSRGGRGYCVAGQVPGGVQLRVEVKICSWKDHIIVNNCLLKLKINACKRINLNIYKDLMLLTHRPRKKPR